jgi:hypothetical protein
MFLATAIAVGLNDETTYAIGLLPFTHNAGAASDRPLGFNLGPGRSLSIQS